MREYLTFGGYDLEIAYTRPFEKGRTPGAALMIELDTHTWYRKAQFVATGCLT